MTEFMFSLLATDGKARFCALDPRVGAQRVRGNYERPMQRFTPTDADAPEGARSPMHGIFMGEVQALEGAGRTCWDFEVGSGNGEGIPEVPFELKLDMARQCWDEARHCEISIKLSAHMGTELGEFSENTFLYEAACNPDPVLRLTGVNRALEGLAIDVFNTMHGRYPANLGEIGRASFRDPWGNAYRYLNIRDDNPPPGRMRKDRFLVPINSDYDLYSMGADGRTTTALTAVISRDDIVRGAADFVQKPFDRDELGFVERTCRTTRGQRLDQQRPALDAVPPVSTQGVPG